jgi:hypothetical protein
MPLPSLAQTIKGVVNYGLNDMPAFPDLTDRLLNNLLLYLGNPASAPEPIASRNEPPPVAKRSIPSRFATGPATACSLRSSVRHGL